MAHEISESMKDAVKEGIKAAITELRNDQAENTKT
jgi:hypothetical protein